MVACPFSHRGRGDQRLGLATSRRFTLVNEVGVMKKFLGAALLALPMLALGEKSARAQGRCVNLAGSFHIKICATGCFKAWCEPFCGCNPCCGGGGYGGAAAYNECHGVVPGPWYTYWPSAQNPAVMTSPYETPGWNYAMNFQTPAPIPGGFPYWPAAAAAQPAATATVAAPPPATNLQPAGYYPSYWYGR
jgi:hypothetical protein